MCRLESIVRSRADSLLMGIARQASAAPTSNANLVLCKDYATGDELMRTMYFCTTDNSLVQTDNKNRSHDNSCGILFLLFTCYFMNGAWPCNVEYWLISVYLPTGIGLFQAANQQRRSPTSSPYQVWVQDFKVLLLNMDNLLWDSRNSTPSSRCYNNTSTNST